MTVVFTNNSGEAESKSEGLEAFLRTVSFNVTWIEGLSVWDSDFEFSEEDSLKNFGKFLFCLCMYQIRKSIYFNESLVTTQIVEKKDMSYGLYKVFYTNYLGFVKHYIHNGVSQACIDWLEKDLLFNFFPYWMVQYKLQNNQLKSSYKSKSYYKQFLIIYSFCFFKIFVKKILHKYKRKVK